MEKKYEVKITRHALAQMQEIDRYISNDLLASEAADNLMNDIKDIKETNYSSWQA